MNSSRRKSDLGGKIPKNKKLAIVRTNSLPSGNQNRNSNQESRKQITLVVELTGPSVLAGQTGAYFRVHYDRERDYLSQGAFGKVYKATDKNGRQWAVKVIEPQSRVKPGYVDSIVQHSVQNRQAIFKSGIVAPGKDGESFYTGIKSEVEHQGKLLHKNVVQFIGTSGQANSTEKVYSIVMEFSNIGNLSSIVHSLEFNQKQENDYKIIAFTLILDILTGLNHIHSCGIVHLDLKCDNILLSSERITSSPTRFIVAKISDFGVSRHTNQEINTPHGTLTYMAPEILLANSDCPVMSHGQNDMYSLGNLIWAIIYRKQPHSALQDRISDIVHTNQKFDSLDVVIEWYMKSKLSLSETPVVPISNQFEEYIKKCWNWKGNDHARHRRPNTQTGIMILKNEIATNKSFRLTGGSSLVQTVKYVDKTVDYTDHVFLCSKMAQLTRQFVRFKVVNTRLVNDIKIQQDESNPEGFNMKKVQPIKRKIDDWTSEISEKMAKVTDTNMNVFKNKIKKCEILKAEIQELKNSLNNGGEYRKVKKSYDEYLQDYIPDLALVEEKLSETQFKLSENVLKEQQKTHIQIIGKRDRICRKRNSNLEPLLIQSKRAKVLSLIVDEVAEINTQFDRSLRNKLAIAGKTMKLKNVQEIEVNVRKLVCHYEEVIKRSKSAVTEFDRLNGMRKDKVKYLKSYSAFPNRISYKKL